MCSCCFYPPLSKYPPYFFYKNNMFLIRCSRLSPPLYCQNLCQLIYLQHYPPPSSTYYFFWHSPNSPLLLKLAPAKNNQYFLTYLKFSTFSPPPVIKILQHCEHIHLLVWLRYCNMLLLTPPRQKPHFAKITTLYNSLMIRCHMSLKDNFLSCLIVTTLTTIFYSLVHRFHMLLKVSFLICLIVALLTIIFYSIMYRFHMLLKFPLLSWLIVTILTTMCNSFVYR